MDKSEILALFSRYKEGNCTEEEVRLLHEWIEKGDFDIQSISEEDILADLTSLERTLPIKKPKARPKYYRIVGYAASILLAIGLFYYYYQSNFTSMSSDDVNDMALTALDPGINKAILQLNDGSSLVLDSLSEDKLLEIDGALVRLNKNGQLIYLPQEIGATPKNNQIIIPKGAQYEVILPDGTHVWLNSESKLSFANSFNGLPERKVELEGEAYFEVNRDVTKPFIVSVQDQQVKVLGTAFNVNAYPENNYVKTSLVEGSVLFNQSKLKPGETAVFEDNKTSISTENMDNITAWKNGYFVFFEETLEEAMKKVSRWYDLEIYFADESTKSILFGGSISKYEHASQVFKMMEKAGEIKITSEGKKITINKTKTEKIMKQ